MQTFKQIPYQNYIELKFNTKNLHEAEKQQAMIKYKRNSQLLTEIFSFRQSPQQPHFTAVLTEPIITQQTLLQFREQIESQKIQTDQKLEKIQLNSRIYEQTINSISQLKNNQQLMAKIDELKCTNLYDQKHPFFVQGSPFFLNSTEQEMLELSPSSMPIQGEQDWQKITLLQLS